MCGAYLAAAACRLGLHGRLLDILLAMMSSAKNLRELRDRNRPGSFET